MNWLDVLLLLPLLVGIVRGFMRGLISEIIAIVVVIFGVLGAKFWAPPFSHWLLAQFAWPQSVCDVVAYVLLFLGIAIALSLIARGLNKFLRAIHLGWANRLFGGVFGLAKYGIIVLIVIFAMEHTDQSFHWIDKSPVVKTSVVYPYGAKLLKKIEHRAGEAESFPSHSRAVSEPTSRDNRR